MRKKNGGKNAQNGYQFMPGGRLMKDSAHSKKKRKKGKRKK